jgi:hypothetical protein
MGSAIFNLKSGWRSFRNILLSPSEVLLEPKIKENPLLGTWPVIRMKVTGDAPILVRKEVHRLINTRKGRMEIIR